MAVNVSLALTALDRGYGEFDSPEILEGIIDWLRR